MPEKSSLGRFYQKLDDCPIPEFWQIGRGQQLNQPATVDLKIVAYTQLYVAPSDVIITDEIGWPVTVTAITVPPTTRLLLNQSDVIFPNIQWQFYTSSNGAANKIWRRPNIGTYLKLQAGDEVGIDVTTGATGTTLLAVPLLFGFFSKVA